MGSSMVVKVVVTKSLLWCKSWGSTLYMEHDVPTVRSILSFFNLSQKHQEAYFSILFYLLEKKE